VKKFIQAVFVSAFLFTVAVANGQQHESVVELTGETVAARTFTKEQILELEKLSDDFSGLPKVELVDSFIQTANYQKLKNGQKDPGDEVITPGQT
jgi:ABC-type amino acid transport substrate-binding protein